MPPRSRAGVCIIRVEQQSHHLLIKVSSVLNLDQDLGHAQPDRIVTSADPEEAISEAQHFLDSFDGDQVV